MKNKISAFLTVLAMLNLGILAPETAHAAPALFLTAPSAVLLDSQNHIIYAKTPHLRRAPASTTKLLTAIVAYEHLDLNDIVTIPGYVAYVEPSKIYLKPGEKYRARELLRAALINSANDAAETLAVAAGGTRHHFVELMNAKAKALGCSGSHFVNPTGLPAAYQYSTAYDLALIMRELEKYPFLIQTLRTRTLIIKNSAGRKIFLRNHNKMLWRSKNEVIGKTGWTRAARHCFVGQIQAFGKTVFVSMLGSHRLWTDLKLLAEYPFGMSWISRKVHDKYSARKSKKVSAHRTTYKKIKR